MSSGPLQKLLADGAAGVREQPELVIKLLQELARRRAGELQLPLPDYLLCQVLSFAFYSDELDPLRLISPEFHRAVNAGLASFRPPEPKRIDWADAGIEVKSETRG